MKHTQPTVRELLIPLDQYPHLNENQTLDEAIYSFLEFRAGQKERLHYAILFVVNNSNQLVGRLTLMDILRAFAPPLFTPLQAGLFDGKKGEYPDLALLHEEAIFAECGKSRMQPIKSFARAIDFTIPAETHLLTAMAMLHSRGEMEVPVTENGTIAGILRLEEIFLTLCTSYCQIPGGGNA
ncbi:CBS domain-containing protein [Desulfogranum mediterraneum]|uniref:CBS domain-containing protein n=1 Tax=Desulfogranum mediterraneum TaxID=160661 RepID=UPI00042A24CB|nr:CBS domain-containing protein [Desulfogranum mediterraneum]